MKKANRIRDLPVLAATERNLTGDLSVWCPFCKCWHHHGAGEGHRVAHCTNLDSPFRESGYIVKRVKPPGEGSKRIGILLCSAFGH